MEALLLLEEGTVFRGESYGDFRNTAGEVVFNTGMTGYQEILTDPSYCGQIVVMTYPLIGNYGINGEDNESRRPFVKGFISREKCDHPGNFRCEGTLDDYLSRNGVPGLFGIDTRKLVRILRESGTMKGALVSAEGGTKSSLADARRLIEGFELSGPVEEVTTENAYECPADEPAGIRVALLDYGVKENIIRSLNRRGVDVTVFPSATPATVILSGGFDGAMLSNGPGDPKDCRVEIDNIRDLAGKIPIFAICLGHQLAALAIGGDTEKLKYGHRGCNHPVKDIARDRTYITSQNHGYAVVADSLGSKGMEITHMNMNDMTVEGIRYSGIPLFSVQFHPEASPGPGDTGYLFDEFIEMMNGYGKGDFDAS